MPLQHTIDPKVLVSEAVHRLHLHCATPERSWHHRIFIRCPFHDEKTASCAVNVDLGIYHCFGCSKSGTIAGMYWDLTERSLYQDLGLSNDEFHQQAMEYHSNYEQENLDILDKDVQIEMKEGSIEPFSSSPLAVKYLRSRGIPFEVAHAMQMGWASNIKIKGSKELDYYTHFTNRLVIPIYEGDKLISIEGRDVVGDQDKKVLYPVGTTVSSLYDLENLDPTKPLYVVEGLMDLAILRTDPFFKNSTAIFGASISRRQIHLLKRFSQIILIPDRDIAGMKVVKKLKEELGFSFSILEIPKIQYQGIDPKTHVVKTMYIKDVGDITKKLNKTVESFRKRKWLDTIRSSLHQRYSEAFNFGENELEGE